MYFLYFLYISQISEVVQTPPPHGINYGKCSPKKLGKYIAIPPNQKSRAPVEHCEENITASIAKYLLFKFYNYTFLITERVSVFSVIKVYPKYEIVINFLL